MNINSTTPTNDDFVVSLLRSQVTQLLKVLNHIEDGTIFSGYIDEHLKSVEKDLRWLRKFYQAN